MNADVNDDFKPLNTYMEVQGCAIRKFKPDLKSDFDSLCPL